MFCAFENSFILYISYDIPSEWQVNGLNMEENTAKTERGNGGGGGVFQILLIRNA